MYEDSSGNFWIGTLLGGLDRFDPKSGIFFHYRSDSRDSNSISDNKVICLYEDHAGAFWVGTSNGLDKFDRNAGMFHRYRINDGLPTSIHGILEDDHGNLWISTNHGLSKFNPGTGIYKNYFENYGLQGDEFSTNACFRSRSGEMIFGGVHGFNIFHPDSIIDDPSLPRVVITDFQIFNKPVAIGENAEGHTILAKSISECDEIKLSYKDNVFSFKFAGLHYASPDGNLYAYMMEGFEKEWNYTDANRRFVTYTNLPGGTYTFRVKASNNQGKWNEKGTSIRVIITPPFWRTIWFYVFLLIAFCGIAYWIYEWRLQARDLVAKRRMEAALTKERNLLRTLIDNLPDAVFVKDLECRKIIANPVDVRGMGAQSEVEVIGKTDHDFFSADTAATSFAEDQSVIQTGVPILGREGSYFDKQGNKLYVLSFKIPLRDEHGTIVGIVGATHNITEQKHAQEALQRERTILRTLIDNIPDAIYIKDENCRKVVANLADVRNMGLQSEAEVLGKDDFELFPRELAVGFFADDQSVIQTGQPVINRDEYIIDEYGQKRWLVTSKLPLRDEKGQIIGLIGIGRDITKRKLAEEALQDERNLLRILIDNLPDLVFFKDTEGRYKLNNLPHLRSLGAKNQEEIIGKTSYNFNPPELAKLYMEDELKVVQSGKPMIDREELAVHQNTGEQRWHLTSKVPLMDSQGKVSGVVGIARDITERKRAEEERERLIKELQNAVADIKVLSGLVPICSSCKKIRDDKGYWTQLEGYIQARSQAKFSHGVCPDCMKKLYPNFVPKKIE
jgi:PAS domain S-box-containing protein